PGPVIITGTPGADDFVMGVGRSQGPVATFEFSDDGDKTRVTVPQQWVTQVIVKGYDGDDRLTINNSYGFFGSGKGLPVNYDGGAGANQLILRGDPRDTVDQLYAVDPKTGGGVLASRTQYLSEFVTFAHVSGIIDTVPARSLSVVGTDGADTISLL